MSQDVVDGDLYVRGTLVPSKLSVPAGALKDAGVAADANIGPSKVKQLNRLQYNQAHGVAAASETRIICPGIRGTTGTVKRVRAALTVACIGAATITIVLKKNGATTLHTMTIDNALTNYEPPKVETVVSGSVVKDDVLSLEITATAGGGTLGQGLAVDVDVEEDSEGVP